MTFQDQVNFLCVVLVGTVVVSAWIAAIVFGGDVMAWVMKKWRAR